MTNFKIYKASAGSGKTYTLVKEYIKRGLQSNNKISQKSLLAMTFTNKAASEMKTRIVDTLFHFSQFPKKFPNESYVTLYRELKTELKYTETQLAEKSKTFLSDIIHYYGLFSVSTIDKFIHKIIRGFSYELNLPSNFEVEMDNEKMIEDSVLSLLDEIGLDNNLTNNLINYSRYKIKEDKNWDIQEDLFKISKQLFKDHTRLFTNNLTDPRIIQSKQKDLVLRIKSFEESFEAICSDIEKIIQGIPESVFLYKDLPRYLKKTRKKPYLDINISNRLQESIQNNRWYKKSETEDNKQKVDNISKKLFLSLKNLIQFINKDYADYLFFRTCYNSFFLVSVLGKIDQKINSIKEENHIIHISEFNQIIYKFLQTSSVPFIYEKIGNRYSHYFLDEFQDTSKTQWNNLTPLVDEALSSGGTCLIVGDGKQSIYRWRGGKVSQFLKLCNQEQDHALSHFPMSIESLETNYRSGKKIVDFNNRFFSFLSNNFQKPYNRLYQNLAQKSHFKETGYIEINMLNPQEEEIIEKTLQVLYEHIELIKQDNYNFSDIVVLTRSNKEITQIATYLTEKGVPIISSESLLLRNSPTIQFLLNNLSIMVDDADYLSKAKFLDYLINNNMIQTESIHETISHYAKTDNIQFQKFLYRSGLDWDINFLKRLNTYELVEMLIRVFKLDKNPNPYVSFFLDFVFEFSIKNQSSISDFLNYWNQKKDIVSIIIPPGINAVEIMTIHKSKGLQFPIVLFAFANWKEDLGKDQQWFNVSSFFETQNLEKNIITLLPLKRELENWPPPFPKHYLKHKSNILLDNINLLYVAMTRPKERLYVISNTDTRKGSIYKYFTDFIAQQPESKLHNDTFIDGEKIIQKPQSNILKTIEKPDFISENWRHRIKIREKRGFNKNLKQKYSIVWGALIHQIMEGVHVGEDIEMMLKRLNVMQKYGHQSYKIIKTEITKIINKKEIKHLFQPGLNTFSETTILNIDGATYRPDRVVEHTKAEASLIDYKTGEKKKSDIDQMKRYESILLQLGYKTIHKYLIYFLTKEIKKL